MKTKFVNNILLVFSGITNIITACTPKMFQCMKITLPRMCNEKYVSDVHAYFKQLPTSNIAHVYILVTTCDRRIEIVSVTLFYGTTKNCLCRQLCENR